MRHLHCPHEQIDKIPSWIMSSREAWNQHSAGQRESSASVRSFVSIQGPLVRSS